MKKEMLINVMQPEECRIAIVEDGVLEELYVERTSHESYVGNIYKGRIVNIEPSIQAAFVDFGVGRNGFLHVSDVEPAYYRHLEQRRDRDRDERGDRGRGDRDNDRGDRGERRDRNERGDSRRGGGGGGGGGRRDRDRDRDRGGRGGRRPSTLGGLPPEELEEIERPLSEDELLGHDSFLRTPEPLPPVVSEVAEAPELTPAPEPEAEERREPQGRGRGRGRGRRGPRENAAEAPAEESAAEPEAPSRENGDEEPPRPQIMDSAERRTDESTPRSGPLEPSSAISDDELLFFPSSEPEPRPAPPPEPVAHAPEPEEYEQPETPPEWAELPAEEPTAVAAERLVADFEETSFVEDAPPVVRPPLPERLRATRPVVEDDDDFDIAENRLPTFDEDEEPMPRRDRGRGPNRDRDRGRGGRDRGRGPMRPGAGRPKPLIQDIFKRGQEVLVQVIKEGIGTKGPTLSTYISIAGRYLVLMPGLNRVGVSRKIADDDQRRRLRDIFHELQPPKGLGFIIRTAGLDKTKKELHRDLAYLSRLWQVVVRRIKKLKAPAEIYQESDMITRTIRDTFTNDIDTIWVDEKNAFEHAQEFLQIVMPRYAARIKHFEDTEPLFHKYGIEDEIARIQRRHVPLPAGGSIVIDQTEALVAIDVNSGNFRADNNAEETAYQMNLQAAKEIARQLRLRDLGGVIVNDFIDMRDEKHRRGVEKALRDAVKRDRARTKILKISQFGLIEMTRQRIRPSLKRSVYQDCPHCHNTGQVKTTESMSIDVMRMVQLAAHREGIHRLQIRVADEVANYLLNKKRREIARLEESGEISVTIQGATSVSPETLEFTCYDNNNNEVKFLPLVEESRERPRRR